MVEEELKFKMFDKPTTLFDNVIIEILDKKQGLIYKADTAVDSLQSRIALVVRCGPGYWNEKTREFDGMVVSEGDLITFKNNAFFQLDAFNDKQLSVRMSDIFEIIGKLDA